MKTWLSFLFLPLQFDTALVYKKVRESFIHEHLQPTWFTSRSGHLCPPCSPGLSFLWEISVFLSTYSQMLSILVALRKFIYSCLTSDGSHTHKQMRLVFHPPSHGFLPFAVQGNVNCTKLTVLKTQTERKEWNSPHKERKRGVIGSHSRKPDTPSFSGAYVA